MGLIGFTEISVTNYQLWLRKIPEYHRSHLRHCGSLKSRKEGAAGLKIRHEFHLSCRPMEVLSPRS